MRRIAITALLFGAAACASGPTGPDAASRFDRFEAVETSDFTGYDQVHLAPPVASEDIIERIGARSLASRGGRDVRPLSERDVEDQLQELEEDLRAALAEEVDLVDEPGPGVLTIRTTLTQLNANRPTQIELSQQPGLSFNSFAAGDASVRYELSENGRLLAVIRDGDNVVSLRDRPLAAGIWETAEQFYPRSANRLAALLQD